jgi:hypothetical protein
MNNLHVANSHPQGGVQDSLRSAVASQKQTPPAQTDAQIVAQRLRDAAMTLFSPAPRRIANRRRKIAA